MIHCLIVLPYGLVIHSTLLLHFWLVNGTLLYHVTSLFNGTLNPVVVLLIVFDTLLQTNLMMPLNYIVFFADVIHFNGGVLLYLIDTLVSAVYFIIVIHYISVSFFADVIHLNGTSDFNNMTH